MKVPAWFSPAAGVLMRTQSAFFLSSGLVPELPTAPFSIAFHQADEFAAAFLPARTA